MRVKTIDFPLLQRNVDLELVHRSVRIASGAQYHAGPGEDQTLQEMFQWVEFVPEVSLTFITWTMRFSGGQHVM